MLHLLFELGLSYFGTYKKKARYTAYNFFTKELLLENAIVYSDKKSRAVKDNFIYYVKDSINKNSQPPKTIIKHLQAIDSKKDDIMQATDLIIGSINNKVTGSRHPLKQAVRQVTEVEFGKKIRYWDWNFTK